MENSDKLTEYSIPQLLRLRFAYSGNKVALREKDFGIWNTYTWSSYYSHVRKTALGMRQIGIKKGDIVAIISDNIPELLFTAIGCHALGAISAGIYQTTMPDEIAQIINSLKITAVFCDNQEQVDKLVDVREKIPKVKKIIYEDPRGMRSYKSDPWFISIKDIYQFVLCKSKSILKEITLIWKE